MPEQYQPRRGVEPYMLSKAAKSHGTYIKASCVGCSRPRWYLPSDVLQLLGDIPTQNLSHVMRCEVCKSQMHAEIRNPLPEERIKIVLRRIDKIWWAKRVSWRNEKL